MARRNDLYISFNGIKSSDLNLKILNMPDRTGAAERGNTSNVLGRDGDLWSSDHSRESIQMPVIMRMQRGADRSEIANWLIGSGMLILSDDPDYFYRARVNGKVSFKRMVIEGVIWDTVEAEFSCHPYKYSLAGAQPLPEISAPMIIDNPGNASALPMIEIHGSGDVNLMIGEYSILVSDLRDYITIDANAMMAFRDGENMSTSVTIVNDDDLWPELKPGPNMINWSGSVWKIIITPYWRWR